MARAKKTADGFAPVNEVAEAKAARKARQAFYTPLPLVERMLRESHAFRFGARLLEPSAGDGRIVHAMRQVARAGAVIDACEIEPAMRPRIEAVGGTVVAEDFLSWNPGEVYDGIAMNPPFTRQQDRKHVEHAFRLLKPDGWLVALTSNWFPRWIDAEELDLPGCGSAAYEVIPAGTFEDFETNVETTLVTLWKNGGAFPNLAGFPNDATENACLTLQTDAAVYAATRDALPPPASLKARWGKLVTETGGSLYGVDWEHVRAYLADYWWPETPGAPRPYVPHFDIDYDAIAARLSGGKAETPEPQPEPQPRPIGPVVQLDLFGEPARA